MMMQVVSLLLLFGPGNSVREDGWVASANGNRVVRWGCATLEIIGVVPTEDEPVSFKARRYARGCVSSDVVEDAVQEESLLAVYVNDILTMQLGCSANHLVELVVGRLFTEGLISGVDEIEAISVCEQSMRADVYLQNREAELSRPAAHIVATCCTNNMTLNEYFTEYSDLVPVQPIPWDPEWIFMVADEFAQDKTAHARTQGSHSAYLAARDRILYVREDIGRHNAFDKVIGSALLDGVDLSQCLLYTSGRVPTDMVTKAIRARIPVLVSKSVATDKTVEIARSLNLALICKATPQSIDVLCDSACCADF